MLNQQITHTTFTASDLDKAEEEKCVFAFPINKIGTDLNSLLD